MQVSQAEMASLGLDKVYTDLDFQGMYHFSGELTIVVMKK
jgi:hypothetical protein